MDDNIIRPGESSSEKPETSEEFGSAAENTSEPSNGTPNNPDSDSALEPTSPEPLPSDTEDSQPVDPTEKLLTAGSSSSDSASDDTPAQPTKTSPASTSRPLEGRVLTLVAGVLVLLIVGACAGGYAFGKKSAKPSMSSVAATAPVASMEVPKGATIIEQCEPGLGTQYILPKDIPDGPVYNVYQGKLIGIEYMADLATMEKLNTVMDNLPLYAQKYDHLNVMTMAAHSGFPTPHYQVDVMMVPKSVTDKITCGGTSSGMSNMPSQGSTTPTPAPMKSSSNMKM